MVEEKNPFVPLTSDGIFKALFRNERYLKDFLEDVLKEKIEGLTYLDTYLEKEDINTKESFLDVLVKYADGNYVIVEMQKYKKGSMITRMLIMSIFFCRFLLKYFCRKTYNFILAEF